MRTIPVSRLPGHRPKARSGPPAHREILFYSKWMILFEAKVEGNGVSAGGRSRMRVEAAAPMALRAGLPGGGKWPILQEKTVFFLDKRKHPPL